MKSVERRAHIPAVESRLNQAVVGYEDVKAFNYFMTGKEEVEVNPKQEEVKIERKGSE